MWYHKQVAGKRQTKLQARAYAAVAQLDRVTGYEPVGRGFESLQPYQKAETIWMSKVESLVLQGVSAFSMPKKRDLERWIFVSVK